MSIDQKRKKKERKKEVNRSGIQNLIWKEIRMESMDLGATKGASAF